MEYKILINSKGVPVLVELPEKPVNTHDNPIEYSELWMKYQDALSTALADESKHIPISQSDHNDLGINWNTAKIGDLYDLPDWYKITTTKSYKVSLTLNEIKPESVPSCVEPRMYSKDELLHALNIGFVAGRSKQTFESFQKEAMEFYETPTKH